MPDTDEEQERYIDEVTEQLIYKSKDKNKEEEAYLKSREYLGSFLAIYWRIRTCITGQELSMRQYFRKEKEFNFWRFSYLYRGQLALALATGSQSIVVYKCRLAGKNKNKI